jgi:outer membrane protein assembly factor BamA
MRPISRALSALVLLASLTTLAQTYTPKTIRIDAPPAVDTAEALRIAALPTNAPLTKQQIETALQRLADTGLFADVAYTVNAAALVIKLTPSASSQLLPARFGNLVWWQPAELESLLEARVPAFHGQLPLAGTLTDQVKAALVSLLHEKGVDATVNAIETASSPGGPITATALAIGSPSILVGDLQLHNALPALQTQLKKFQDRLHGEDFDLAETTRSVQASVNDIYRNAGYLAVDTSAPTYSAPRKDLLNYAVDLTSTITPGDLYHLNAITLHAAPPVSEADLLKAANLKPGDIASPAAERLARAEMQNLYAAQGYLTAKVHFTPHQDNAAHTVDYAYTFVPGDLYHFASIDTSALALDQQAAFARAFTIAPGAIADTKLSAAIGQALQSLHLGYKVGIAAIPDPATHTVKLVLKTAASPAH